LPRIALFLFSISKNVKWVLIFGEISASLFINKGPITWSIFNPGVELSPVYRVEISALSVILLKTLSKSNARLHDKIFNPGLKLTICIID
jgi:hypothetical protein